MLRDLPLSLCLPLFFLSAVNAKGSQIIGSSTGLTSPASTVTFDETVLPMGTAVTNQFATYGVTFSPNVYYSVMTGYQNFGGNDVGNYNADGTIAINPLTISFTATQNAAAFAMAADAGTPYQFTALLNGATVDTFTSIVGYLSANDFYGFANENFNAIVINQVGTGGGPYYDIDNIQLLPAAVTPEPSSLVLLGTGVVVIAGMARRKLLS